MSCYNNKGVRWTIDACLCIKICSLAARDVADFAPPLAREDAPLCTLNFD